ncbi:MAG: carboxylating nicotinate-nucleotide diphosphorylase [Cellulosilyticaceae bacterium]
MKLKEGMKNFMNNGVTMLINADKWIKAALEEDITSEDVTTVAIMREDKLGTVELICKEDGVLAGINIFKRVFELLGEIKFETNFKDGDEIVKGQVIGILEGSISVLLSGERTALNYLQRMSGIATFTNKFVKVLEGKHTRLLDTRKTTPGMRIFEKYSVKVGGGYNHRYNLSDGILLKDNHIAAAGGVKEAVQRAKEYAPFVRKIEVEVESLEMVEEAVEAKADIIMLDNMGDEMMREAVKLINGKALTECSGNVTLERLAQIAETGVDYVSCGALTHSAPILDLSMKNLRTL